MTSDPEVDLFAAEAEIAVLKKMLDAERERAFGLERDVALEKSRAEAAYAEAKELRREMDDKRCLFDAQLTSIRDGNAANERRFKVILEAVQRFVPESIVQQILAVLPKPVEYDGITAIRDDVGLLREWKFVRKE